MFGDLCLHVGKTGVGQLDGVPVANFKKLVVWRKRGPDDLQELFTEVSLDILAPRWVPPGNFSLSVSLLLVTSGGGGDVLVESQGITVTCLTQCCLVCRLGFIKNFRIRGDLTQSVVDIFWQILLDIWGMIGSGMNILDIRIRLGVRLVQTRAKIKSIV